MAADVAPAQSDELVTEYDHNLHCYQRNGYYPPNLAQIRRIEAAQLELAATAIDCLEAELPLLEYMLDKVEAVNLEFLFDNSKVHDALDAVTVLVRAANQAYVDYEEDSQQKLAEAVSALQQAKNALAIATAAAEAAAASAASAASAGAAGAVDADAAAAGVSLARTAVAKAKAALDAPGVQKKACTGKGSTYVTQKTTKGMGWFLDEDRAPISLRLWKTLRLAALAATVEQLGGADAATDAGADAGADGKAGADAGADADADSTKPKRQAAATMAMHRSEDVRERAQALLESDKHRINEVLDFRANVRTLEDRLKKVLNRAKVVYDTTLDPTTKDKVCVFPPILDNLEDIAVNDWNLADSALKGLSINRLCYGYVYRDGSRKLDLSPKAMKDVADPRRRKRRGVDEPEKGDSDKQAAASAGAGASLQVKDDVDFDVIQRPTFGWGSGWDNATFARERHGKEVFAGIEFSTDALLLHPSSPSFRGVATQWYANALVPRMLNEPQARKTFALPVVLEGIKAHRAVRIKSERKTVARAKPTGDVASDAQAAQLAVMEKLHDEKQTVQDRFSTVYERMYAKGKAPADLVADGFLPEEDAPLTEYLAANNRRQPAAVMTEKVRDRFVYDTIDGMKVFVPPEPSTKRRGRKSRSRGIGSDSETDEDGDRASDGEGEGDGEGGSDSDGQSRPRIRRGSANSAAGIRDDRSDASSASASASVSAAKRARSAKPAKPVKGKATSESRAKKPAKPTAEERDANDLAQLQALEDAVAAAKLAEDKSDMARHVARNDVTAESKNRSHHTFNQTKLDEAKLRKNLASAEYKEAHKQVTAAERALAKFTKKKEAREEKEAATASGPRAPRASKLPRPTSKHAQKRTATAVKAKTAKAIAIPITLPPPLATPPLASMLLEAA